MSATRERRRDVERAMPGHNRPLCLVERWSKTSLAVDPEPVPLTRDEHGAWRVGGTRVTLETLVAAFDRGDSAEEIHEQYPSVALGDVYAVLTYCLRHPVSVKEYLTAREVAGAEVQARVEAEFPPEGLRARLVSRLGQ